MSALLTFPCNRAASVFRSQIQILIDDEVRPYNSLIDIINTAVRILGVASLRDVRIDQFDGQSVIDLHFSSRSSALLKLQYRSRDESFITLTVLSLSLSAFDLAFIL